MGGLVEPLSGPGLQREWSYVTGLNTGRLAILSLSYKANMSFCL